MANLSKGQKWKRYALSSLSNITGGVGDLNQRIQGPYVRVNEGWAQKLNPANLLFGGIGDYDQAAELRSALASQMDPASLEFWNSMSADEQDALIEKYYSSDGKGLHNLWGFDGTTETFDVENMLKDLSEASQLESKPVYDVDLDQIQTNASKAVEDENEKLLESLNADLKSMGDAYTNSRNALLTQQHQRNTQTVDAMSSDMARARRNAIEAGASAGVRIAGNVNALLSAQNKMSQQSLETSNQLAQMLVNQRNAEAGLRSQWRDIQSSTYERTQNRAANDLNFANAKYDQKVRNWQDKNDTLVSETNPLRDPVQKFKNKSAYSNSGNSAYGG